VSSSRPAATRTNGVDRIAWLLRTNRIYGPDERLVTGAVFARAFAGERWRQGVDGAQITRWERASQKAGYPALRRYEELLGLPTHHLVVVADTIYRERHGRAGAPLLSRDRASDAAQLRTRTLALLERALGGDVMTGQHWDDLTTGLWGLPGLVLYPPSLWSDLAQRLVSEMIIAEDLDWLYRNEALARLLGHPDGELAVISACAALAADPSSQVVIDPLMVLEASGHHESVVPVLRQIGSPASAHAHHAAWLVAAEKVAHGHFSVAQRRRLAQHAFDVMAEDSDVVPHRIAAAEILRQLDPRTSGSLPPRVRRLAGRDPSSSHVLHTGRTMGSAAADTIIDRVAARTMSSMPRDALRVDPMLRFLLDEMLFHPRMSRRFVATCTIGASPYAPAVDQALMAELRSHRLLADPTTAPAMIAAMGYLGDGRVRQFLEPVALDPSLPEQVTVAALRALAHCAGHSAGEFWQAASRRYAASAAHARALVYAFGIARDQPMLRRYRAQPPFPGAREAASWWLNIPSHISASTTRLVA
jgi:hypothetical protein